MVPSKTGLTGIELGLYFCDFGKYQTRCPPGESPFVSDANVSYKRSALESIRSTWQETFHETAVNWALASRGEKLTLSPKIIVYQNRGSLRLGNALKERFIWGRSYAATRGTLAGGSKRRSMRPSPPVLPLILLARMAANVLKKRRCIGAFLKALPLTATLTVSWSSGELAGYLTGRANSSGAAAGGIVARASND